MRIGGADMPVLISFLNATSGLAAALCGIIIQNRLLIACGATVAASGSILTYFMCKAMNRRLIAVFVGIQMQAKPLGSESAEDAPSASEPASETATVPTSETPRQQDPFVQAVEAVRGADSVVVVPGYGMALAHAQFETVRLADRLQAAGKTVKFAVHPIAGRMPGHMHVLLAEAEVDPDMLAEIDEINPHFPSTDLAVIVGACDVVNPAAIEVSGTPISGMPILEAHNAKQLVVCNLDEKPGYSGVDNPLYADPKTILLLGDAKATLGRLLENLKPETQSAE